MDVTVQSDDIIELLDQPLVRALLDNISQGALVIHAHSREILAMNRVARGLLGYDEEGVVGCQCRHMMNSPACTTACPLTALLEGRAEGGALDLYYRGREGDQVLHAHTRMLVVRDPEGVPLAGIELFEDLREVRRLRRALRRRTTLHGIIGRAPSMQALYELVEQVAPYDIPILITGESGVGKERFADAVRHLSERADRAFVKVNCAALAPSLVESELFGHRRGAFTGAIRDRVGRFEEAGGGTLLLDEVGDLPLPLQAKLLRVLQEGEVQRIGEERTRHVDVRIIAATNRDLERDVGRGQFRQDLYYRLMGARIHIPPLRERREDILLLAEHFIDAFNREAAEKGGKRREVALAPNAESALLERPWPGNVRELENTMRLAAIRAQSTGRIGAEHVRPPAGAPSDALETTLSLRALEQAAIDKAMDRTDGNVSAAARLLEIDRSTLWRKLKRGGA